MVTSSLGVVRVMRKEVYKANTSAPGTEKVLTMSSIKYPEVGL